MRRLLIVLATLGGAAFIRPTAHGDELAIAQAVVRELRTEKLAGNLLDFNIEVKADEVTVWLVGSVSTAEQAGLVMDCAKRSAGVQRIVNELSVRELKNTDIVDEVRITQFPREEREWLDRSANAPIMSRKLPTTMAGGKHFWPSILLTGLTALVTILAGFVGVIICSRMAR